jgi:RHS repeat-associated protein
MKKILYKLLFLVVLGNTCNSYSQVTSRNPNSTPIEECPDSLWYVDSDGDGLGNPLLSTTHQGCDQPPTDYVDNGDDCDDSSKVITTFTWYYDGDKDGYGDANIAVSNCAQPLNYVANNSDCNDSNYYINPTTRWYLDTNGDGIGSDLDNTSVLGCAKPVGNYFSTVPDSSSHWIHQVSYDAKGNITQSSRTYFDDLAKSNVSLSKDFEWKKIWGTETIYDNFGRPDKTSFIAPSPLNTFAKTNFLKSNSQVSTESYPAILPLNAITASKDYKASESISVIGAISTGLTVSLTSPSITFKNTFSIKATAGSSFIATAATLPDASANVSLANYYSDSNADELYQATATHPFAQNNYDILNPGNVINTVGGNKINREWKTGYIYTVPAAQEMYYVYGSEHFNDNRNVSDYVSYSNKIYPEYDNLGLTWYLVKIVNSQSDILPLSALPSDSNANGITGVEHFDLKANTPLERGMIYKVLRYGSPIYVQVLLQPSQFRNIQNLWPSMKIVEGPWDNYQSINEYNSNLELSQRLSTLLQNQNNTIAGLKCLKTISIDSNGIENVSFTDTDGKLLASARSGGETRYKVTSLIGDQGYVDIHLPKGCQGTLSFINGSSLYKVYDLKTGNLLSDTEKANMEAGIYRIELISKTTTSPLVYLDKTNGSVNNVSVDAKGVTYSVNYYDYAINIYNKTGQLIKSVQPNGYVANSTITALPAHMTSSNFASTFKYDTLGQLVETTSPDEGTSRFAYRQDGQIRYSQSALQADTKVSYTDYDALGRPIESGVITNNWATASANPYAVLIPGARAEQTFTIYDDSTNNETSVQLPTAPTNLTLVGVLTQAGINTSNYIQNNLSGNVAITYTKPGAAISAITWYSYDLYGRTEWIVQYNEGIGAKTIHYEYDHNSSVKRVLFQKDIPSELFIHQYTYNPNNGSLIKVETATDLVPQNLTTHADYSYYKTGELKRVNIAKGLQGLDYVYTLGGQLKSINHPSLEETKDPGKDKNDVFGLTLDYYNGDYLRSNRNISSSPTAGSDYNGNIKATRWNNKYVPNDVGQKGYLYNYDRNNWLTTATFGNTDPATARITPVAKLAEKGITYDANGNIQTLQRTNELATETIVDNLEYKYNTGKNQLNYVIDKSTVPANSTDIQNQNPNNYEYNVIGQMTRNSQENLYYKYNTQGLVTEVGKGTTNALVRFYYNERGQRIKKESFNTSTFSLQSATFYILDLSGNTMAVYNLPTGGNIVQTDLPIFGLNRLGMYNRNTTISNYEITDHLGNVRATIPSKDQVVAPSYADYYPFGELLPSRNSLNYRYAFQGQELDKETGMEAFQLRLWDGRLGRWLSPDPHGQYASPYLGMGNNPISLIDPDGGSTISPGAPPSLWQQFKNFLSGGSAVQLDEVVVQGKGKSSSSSIFSGLLDFNPLNAQATDNRNFLYNWFNSDERKEYTTGLEKTRSALEWIPGVDSYFSVVADKAPGTATLQLGANFIPLGKFARPAKNLVPKVVTNGMTKILLGEAAPIMKNGAVEVLSKGVGSAPKKWLGAIHYRIEDVAGSSMNGSRILVKEVNGQKIYGYIKDHNYKDVYSIATSSELIWP